MRTRGNGAPSELKTVPLTVRSLGVVFASAVTSSTKPENDEQSEKPESEVNEYRGSLIEYEIALLGFVQSRGLKLR